MHIAILTWWISTERAVALRSGTNMSEWVKIAWHTSEVFDVPQEIDAFLSSYKKFDLIIPVLHGRYGEDGIITWLCESLGIKVSGCSSWVHALCIDKFHTNCVVEKLWVHIPKSWIPGLPKPVKLLPDDNTKTLEMVLIVKPNQWGSSLATTRATTLEEFKYGLQSVNETIESLTAERMKLLSSTWTDIFQRYFPSLHDIPLVQECIPGKEFTVGVYHDQNGTHVLPIIEIITLKQDFFDYEEKYETDGSNEVFSDIEPLLKNNLETTSSNIYNFLGCRGIVRMDYRYDGKNIYFLEVNTIPGFTGWSLVPKMWKKAGKTEKEFIEMLVL